MFSLWTLHIVSRDMCLGKYIYSVASSLQDALVRTVTEESAEVAFAHVVTAPLLPEYTSTHAPRSPGGILTPALFSLKEVRKLWPLRIEQTSNQFKPMTAYFPDSQ